MGGKRRGERRWRRRPRQEGAAEAGDPSGGGAGRAGGRRPGCSQRKEKARRSRYLCGRSERRRGSRGLQQFHLDLLRHRRRRCGRRLGHVALDHWRKVGSKLAASPSRRVPSSPPPSPAPRCLLPAPGAARGSAPRSPLSGRGTGPGHFEKRDAGQRGGGSGAGSRPAGGVGRAQSGGGDGSRGRRGRSSPGGREGARGARAQGEARRKARVTRQPSAEKFPAGGAGRVGSGPAAARRRGTRAGKFSKPRKRGLAPGSVLARAAWLGSPCSPNTSREAWQPAGGSKAGAAEIARAPFLNCTSEICGGLRRPPGPGVCRAHPGSRGRHLMVAVMGRKSRRGAADLSVAVPPESAAGLLCEVQKHPFPTPVRSFSFLTLALC